MPWNERTALVQSSNAHPQVMSNHNDIENGQDSESGGEREAASKKSKDGGAMSFLVGPVDTQYGDLVLLAHSVASGMIDAACFSNWSVFGAMQTGNTVILGLSIATNDDSRHAWVTTLVSICSFLLGAFFTFRLTLYFFPNGAASNRLYVCSLFMAQAVFIFIAAALVAAEIIPHNPNGMVTLSASQDIIDKIRIVGALPLIGFQAGIQISCSRLLGFSELPVNVLTSTYCDIMGDTNLLGQKNVKRNRRVAAVVLLFAGAIISGWLMRSRGGLPAALFTAGGIKFFAAIGAFFLFKRKTD